MAKRRAKNESNSLVSLLAKFFLAIFEKTDPFLYSEFWSVICSNCNVGFVSTLKLFLFQLLSPWCDVFLLQCVTNFNQMWHVVFIPPVHHS